MPQGGERYAPTPRRSPPAGYPATHRPVTKNVTKNQNAKPNAVAVDATPGAQTTINMQRHDTNKNPKRQLQETKIQQRSQV